MPDYKNKIEKKKKFIDEGLYLPEIFRDDKKRLKLMKIIKNIISENDHKNLQDLTIKNLHVLIVNKFLWLMAEHGYTLQKSRAEIDFSDLKSLIENGHI